MIKISRNNRKLIQKLKEIIKTKENYVFISGCGTGKSATIKKLLEDKSNQERIIFCTNNKERLREIALFNSEVAIIKSQDEHIEEKAVIRQIVELMNAKHLALTTQMYELMSEHTRYFLHIDRPVLIIDEEVDAEKLKIVSFEDISRLTSRLEKLKDKEKIKSNLKSIEKVEHTLKKDLIKLVEETKDNTFKYIEIKNSKRKEDVIEIIEFLLGKDFINDNEIKETLIDTLNIYKNGAIFFYEKNRLINSKLIIKKEKSVFEEAKCVVILDATANLKSSIYKDFKIVNLKNNKQGNRIKLNVMNIPINQDSFKDKELINAINDWLVYQNDKDIELIITHRNLTNRIKIPNKLYYGNVRGFNDYRDLTSLLLLGYPRQHMLNYVIEYLSCNLEEVEDMKKTKRNRYIKYFDTEDKGAIINSNIDNIMSNRAVEELIQAIYRTNLRNRDSKKSVQVYLFMNYEKYNNVLMNLCENLGVKSINFLSNEYIMNKKRENKKPTTNKGRLIKYLKGIKNNTTNKEIMEELNLSETQLRAMLKKDDVKKFIKENFKKVNTKPLKYIKK